MNRLRRRYKVWKVDHALDKLFEKCKEENWDYAKLNEELLLLWAREGLLQLDSMSCSVMTGMDA